MRRDGIHLDRTEFAEYLRRLRDAPCGIYHIIDDEAGLCLDIAYHILNLGLIVLLAPLIHDCNRDVEDLGELPCSCRPSCVRRDYHHILRLLVKDVFGKEREEIEIVAWDVKESLDLWHVELEEDDPINACGLYHVRNQLCGD